MSAFGSLEKIVGANYRNVEIEFSRIGEFCGESSILDQFQLRFRLEAGRIELCVSWRKMADVDARNETKKRNRNRKRGGGERKKKKKNKYRREGHIQSFLAQHRDPSARRCVNNCFILL